MIVVSVQPLIQILHIYGESLLCVWTLCNSKLSGVLSIRSLWIPPISCSKNAGAGSPAWNTEFSILPFPCIFISSYCLSSFWQGRLSLLWDDTFLGFWFAFLIFSDDDLFSCDFFSRVSSAHLSRLVPLNSSCFKFFLITTTRTFVEISCFLPPDPLTLTILNAQQHSFSSSCYGKWPQGGSFIQLHTFFPL